MGPKFALRGRQSYTAVASNSVKKNARTCTHFFKQVKDVLLNSWSDQKNEFTYPQNQGNVNYLEENTKYHI